MARDAQALEDEVYGSMKRWRNCNAWEAEFGLIGITVGMDFEGEPLALQPGEVLGAVREALAGGKDQ